MELKTVVLIGGPANGQHHAVKDWPEVFKTHQPAGVKLINDTNFISDDIVEDQVEHYYPKVIAAGDWPGVTVYVHSGLMNRPDVWISMLVAGYCPRPCRRRT